MKPHIYILDTSVLLSGKPINLNEGIMITTPSVAGEIQPGGRDYRNFSLLQEKGLTFQEPSDQSRQKVLEITKVSGDEKRLSLTDRDILALALDLLKNAEVKVTILTDDYSIQNVASYLKIEFCGFSQRGIIKKYKWKIQCPGCGKQFKNLIHDCPICGSTIDTREQKSDRRKQI